MFKSRSLSRNTLILLIGNIGSTLLAFSLSVLIGRFLGEDGLGTYATILSWIFPLILLAEFGTNTLITRDVSTNINTTASYLRAITLPRVIFSSILAIILAIFAPYLSSSRAVITGLWLSAPLLIIEPAFGAYTAVFRAHHNMLPIPLLNLGMLVIQLILSILILDNGHGIEALIAINTITSCLRLIAAWFIYRWQFRSIEYKPEPNFQWQFLIPRALPFMIAGVLAASQMRVNIVLLEQLAGVGAVGYFAVATRFTEAIRMIPQAFFDALLPTLSALSQKQNERRQTFHRSLIGISAYGVAVGIGFSIIAMPLIKLTYGSNFMPAIRLTIIAGWLLLPSLLRGSYVLYWYALKREQFVNITLGVMLMLRVGLSFILIPRYGALGAIVTGGIAETIGLLLLILRPKTNYP